MTAYTVGFPTAVAQLVANRLNNTLFASDCRSRVDAITAHAIRFTLLDRDDLAVIDSIIADHDGEYMYSGAIKLESLS